MSFGVTLLARTATAEGEAPAFASFVVEKGTEGFTMGPKMRGIGWRGLDTASCTSTTCGSPTTTSWAIPRWGSVSSSARSRSGASRSRRCRSASPRPCSTWRSTTPRQREQFGQPISKFQAIQFKLADIATELEAARWLTYRAASLRDTGRPFLKEASMAKLKASRLAVAAASEAVQIHGGLGYMLESPVARFYCDAKVLEIGEGTNEIQHVVIARELLA